MHKDPEKRKEYERKRNKDPERKRRNKERTAKWKAENPEKAKKQQKTYMLKRLYGLTYEEFSEMYELQGGKCANASCSREAEYVDHDHVTKKVRGLLCKQCNFAIGLLLDDIDMVKGIEVYLLRSKNV